MTNFPIDNAIFYKIIEVFTKTRGFIFILFPLAFLLRIGFNFIMFKNVRDFLDILKDSLFLTLGLYFFEDLLSFIIQIPYFIASEISVSELKNIKLSGGFFVNKFKYITDMLGIFCYWISFGLYVAIISLLGFFAGYILFIGTMFRYYGLLRVFTLLLFVAGLWPLIWYSINFAIITIAVSENAFSNNVIVSSASIAKVIFPVWILSKSSKIPQIQTTSRDLTLFSKKIIEKGFSKSQNLASSFSKKEEETENKALFLKEQIDEIYQEDSFENDFSIQESINHQDTGHQVQGSQKINETNERQIKKYDELTFNQDTHQKSFVKNSKERILEEPKGFENETTS